MCIKRGTLTFGSFSKSTHIYRTQCGSKWLPQHQGSLWYGVLRPPLHPLACMGGRDPHCVNGTTILAVLVGNTGRAGVAVVYDSWCDIWNFWKLHTGCVLTVYSFALPLPSPSLFLISHLYSFPAPPPLPLPSPHQGGPPSVLSMLQSAVRGQAGFGEGEEEECATCGSVGTDLKQCLGCKQVRTMSV